MPASDIDGGENMFKFWLSAYLAKAIFIIIIMVLVAVCDMLLIKWR